MMSITRTLRQKLPSNLKAASNFSYTAAKAPLTSIHTTKLAELHHTLHANKEADLRLRGLRLHDMPSCPASSPAYVALHNQGRAMTERPIEFRSMHPPSTASIAGAAKQTISAMISASAESQINKIRESHGRLQDKYLYGNKHASSKPTASQAATAQPKSTSTSAAVSEAGKDVASIFGNKVKKAQRTLSNEDLANAFDL